LTDTFALLQAALADRYRLERELGQGGMALVFLAQDLRHDRPVALKVLRPEMATPLGTDRFLREVRIAGQLRHPHILPMLDSGTAVGGGFRLPYYTMPVASGQTLRTLAARGPLPGAVAVGLVREVAQALAYAHRAGVIHRDIKPDNVFVEDGHAVVADFGIARAMTPTGSDRLTSTGVALGTPAYMSPEQLVGVGELDGRADQYSLGCILAELLTGVPPFPAPTMQGSLARRLSEAPGFAAALPAGMSPEIAAALDRALAPAPADRYPDMAEFSEALAAAAPPPLPSRSTGRWLLVASVTGLVAVLAILASRTRPIAAPPPEALPATRALAILPFEVRGGPDYAYLGPGLVDLLGTTLDGVAGLRTVDARALIRAAGDAPLDDRASDELARRFGASFYIVGDVLEAGGRLRVAAALHRVGDAAAVARASAQGRADALFEVVDSLTVSLLTAWGEADSRVSGLAARTTTSLPALRAWLDGEAALRALRFEEGAAAYRRAVEADSAFALAWYRLSITAEWLVQSDLAHESAERAVRLANRLPARDSLLLVAMRAGRRGDIETAEPIYRRLVGANPEEVEAWLQLGELLFHYGPSRGRRADESREAWRRVGELEPDLVAPIVHLARLAARAGRVGELDSLRRTLAALRAGSPVTEAVRSDLLEVETLQAFATRDTAAQARVLAELAGASDLTVVLTAWAVASWTDDLAGAVRVTNHLAAPRRAPVIRAVGEVLAGALEAARGRWTEARRRFAAAEELHSPLGAQYAAYYALAPIGIAPESEALSLVAAIPDPALADTSPESLDLGAYFTIPYRAPALVRRYLQGLAAATVSPAAALEVAAEVGRAPARIGSPGPEMLAAGIRSEVEWRRGGVEAARAAIASAPPHAWYGDAISSVFISGPRERWRMAEALERLGRPTEAAAWYHTFSDRAIYDVVFLAPAERRLAQLAEQQGGSAEARRHWARFAALWKDADPALQPLVAEAGRK
jgi:serine/threonine-protein kinase